MERFRHFGTVFVKEDRETGKVVQKPCFFIAKFHYTDTDTGPTRTRTDPTEFRRKKVRVRVRVVEFSSYPTTCADFVRVGSVSGPCPCPCSGI